MTTVLFLTHSLNTPSTRNRILFLAEALKPHGIRSVVEPTPDGLRARSRLFARAADFDVTVLQKKLITAWFLRSLRKRARALVYDFDDAIVYRTSRKGATVSRTRAGRFRRIVAAAGQVWAANPYLADLARPHLAEGARLEVVPTVVNVRDWTLKERHTNDGPARVVGWMGGPANLVYLRDIAGALREVARRVPGAVLRIVSQDFLDLPGVPIERVRWTQAEEAEQVRAFDVGIAPLRDDVWSRGKCCLKILNYSAAGLPVVASPVGVNADAVAHGKTGFHASTAAEWIDGLRRLLADPSLRQRQGRAGRRLVEENYSVDTVVPKVRDLLLAAARPPSLAARR